MGKILIIPDVHGRTFWFEACDHKDDFEKIVFLGDYVSPYPDEDISNERAIEIFNEVLDFKKENPEKVVLLLGNHDLSYFNTEICECRTDHKNWSPLNTIYTENLGLFDLAWETKIGDKRYFFSHSGVRKGWLKCIAGEWFEWEDLDTLPPADMFNNTLHTAYSEGKDELRESFEYLIGVYSSYRGWGGWDYGSIVWADIREYGNDIGIEYPDVMFICGHTQLENRPIITDWVADLDVRRPFVLDTETGKIEEYE